MITTEGILISLVRRVTAFPPRALPSGFLAVQGTGRQVLMAPLTQPVGVLLHFGEKWGFRSEMLTENFWNGPCSQGPCAGAFTKAAVETAKSVPKFKLFFTLAQNSNSFAILFLNAPQTPPNMELLNFTSLVSDRSFLPLNSFICC